MRTLLGIDLGTSSVKVVLTDETLRVLTSATREYPVDRPRPGWSETDPQLWWAATVEATRQVLAAGHPAPAAIGFSGQMHGVVLSDRHGRAVRPAMLWSDTRAVDLLDVYRDLPDEVLRGLGNPLSPGMAGPLLGWLARHETATLAAAHRALQPKDWLRSRLTGEFAAEPGDASATLLQELDTGSWSTEVVAALGVPESLLPEMLPSSTTLAGTLISAAAAELGIPAGTPVAAGTADTAAAALGSGLTTPGIVQLTIGSGTQTITAVTAPRPSALPLHPVTHLYRGALQDSWYAMAATLNGGLALDWVRRTHQVSWEQLYAAAGDEPHQDDPLFLPYLGGERTPLLDPLLTGSWIGLTARHDTATLLRCALEGVAGSIADALDALPGPTPDVVRLAGGGTVVPAWRQLLADVLGVGLDALEVAGASGVGAAATAAPAGGVCDESELLELLQPALQRVAEPVDAAHHWYRERRDRRSDILDRLGAAH
ncbi:FGGY family carbohydrate kinase [Nakamurella sp. A5-74]|uniref:FGGY family carbohydrate kinase n=1 Tax=Nakamurella sp. A5-74 TaxID=3158264 RepID=A0AAU8DP24_9ACTN